MKYFQDEILIGTSSFAKGNYTLILRVDGVPLLKETVIIQ